MDIRTFVKKHFSNDPDIVLALGSAFGGQCLVQVFVDDPNVRNRLAEAGCNEAQITRIEEAVQHEGYYKNFAEDEAHTIIGTDTQAESIAARVLQLPGNPYRNLLNLLRAAGRENDLALRARIHGTEQWQTEIKEFALVKHSDPTDDIASLGLTTRALLALKRVGVVDRISQSVNNSLFNERALYCVKNCGRRTVGEIRRKFETRGISLPKDGPTLPR